MPTSRRYGGTRVMSAPSISIDPPLGVMKPATMRSVVVLPGPRRAEQRHEFAATDLEVDPVHGHRAPERLAQTAQDERGAVRRGRLGGRRHWAGA